MSRSVVPLAQIEAGISGNFRQKEYPVNPVSYMHDRGITDIFRYVQTHPDMDHMDGIKTLFEIFCPCNFWDTSNTKEISGADWERSPYNEEDWKYYKKLRDAAPDSDPKRLTLHAGATGQYYNRGEDGSRGGDGLHVLAPTEKLVADANTANQDYNRCSYVLLYRTGGHRIRPLKKVLKRV